MEDFMGTKLTMSFFIEDNEELRDNSRSLLENIVKQFADIVVKQAQIKSRLW